MTTILWLSSCAVDPGVGAPEPNPPIGEENRVPVRSPVVVHESVPSQGDEPADWLFANDIVHTIDITVSDASYTALDNNPFEYTGASLTIDGLDVPEVGIRLRGAIGSFREIWDKPKFKVEFDWSVPGRDFFGLEELALNNSVADCSYLKEAVAYRIFEEAGIPRPRLSFARVTLNGIDYGLYQVVESEDENFLARVQEDPTGNFYDGKYIWFGGWSYTLIDFDPSVQDLYKLEEGLDVAHADVHAVTDAVVAGQFTPDFLPLTDPVVDWDQWHMVLAVEEFIGHNDGYALNQNNYRVYFDPEDGKAEMFPWDLDNTFLEDYWWGMSWLLPRGKLAAACWADPDCWQDHAVVVDDLLTRMESLDVESYVAELHALTYEDAMSDPKLPTCAAYVEVNRTAILTWVDSRPADLIGHWDL